MKSEKGLSARQLEILDFLETFIATSGYPPSVREIGEAVGLASSSTVHSHLNSLEDKGFIKRDPTSARAITVCDKAKSGKNKSSDSGKNDFDSLNLMGAGDYSRDISRLGVNVVALPVLGRVAAGTPMYAEQNIEDSMVLPTQIVGDNSSFMLTVKGESMIEAGIYSGDYVVVKEQKTANNGDIVVALIDDEATVKTFYREPDRIRLQPENETMEPIYARDVMILGKVVALLRAL